MSDFPDNTLVHVTIMFKSGIYTPIVMLIKEWNRVRSAFYTARQTEKLEAAMIVIQGTQSCELPIDLLSIDAMKMVLVEEQKVVGVRAGIPKDLRVQ